MQKHWLVFVCLIGLSACDQIGFSKSPEKAFEEFDKLVHRPIEIEQWGSIRSEVWMMEDCVLSQLKFSGNQKRAEIFTASADLSKVKRVELRPWDPQFFSVILERGYSGARSSGTFDVAHLDESFVDNIKAIYRTALVNNFTGNSGYQHNIFMRMNSADGKATFWHAYPNDIPEILDAFLALVKTCGGVIGN